MRFKTFIEMTDVLSQDTSHINFQYDDYDQSYKYFFKIGSDEFQITLSQYIPYGFESEYRIEKKLIDSGFDKARIEELLKNIYDVCFRGPNSFRLTNAFKQPTYIYSQLLLSIKKFAEVNNVEGLTFNPYERIMGPMYNKFIKQFTDFKVVDWNGEIYLSQKLINKILAEAKNDTFEKSMVQAQERYEKKLVNIKNDKTQKRQKLARFKAMIGKFISIRDFLGREIIMLPTRIDYGDDAMLIGQMCYRPGDLALVSIVDDKRISYALPQKCQEFKKELEKSEYDSLKKACNYTGEVYNGPLAK